MIRLRELNRYRDKEWELRMVGVKGDDFGGCFVIASPIVRGITLRCIACNDGGWDHVSISPSIPRTPTWAEMEHVKRLFFKPDEIAMQLHVPPTDHINVNPYVLHLWRPHEGTIPLPPPVYV